MIFWIVVFLLFLISMAWVGYFFYKPIKNNQNPDTNLNIAKEKIAQLKLDVQNNTLSENDFAAAEKDIKQTLATELEDNTVSPNQQKNTSILISSIIFSFVLIFGIYQYLGSPQSINNIKKQQPSVAQILLKMEQHLAKNPKDIKGLTLLGQTYFRIGQLKKAKITFKKAYLLKPNNEEIILGYLATLAALNNNSVLGEPSKLIQKVLTINPNNIQGLWFAGFAAYQTGNYKLAEKTWKKTYSLMDKKDPEREIIKQYLTEIKQLQQEHTKSESSKTEQLQTKQSKTSQAKITIKLDIDKKIKANKSDFVMIYARATNGSRMPIAIKKIRASQLPTTITLTDNDAVMPTRKLSQMREVFVFVRLSKTGQAMQQKGDVVVKSKAINPQSNTTIKLLIK
ncbi:Cytochrome c heme lyase subunit CcmH [hydrothermal vent metagenome]|uniref:Cytochrome c heme lyase subunit CcmH n=1 Tax=hydrothermal vent metagenome TaxID=652676 RepID=A0A1W1CVC8_9ZZZZ